MKISEEMRYPLLENRGGGRRGFADLVAGLAVYSPKAHGYFN